MVASVCVEAAPINPIIKGDGAFCNSTVGNIKCIPCAWLFWLYTGNGKDKSCLMMTVKYKILVVYTTCDIQLNKRIWFGSSKFSPWQTSSLGSQGLLSRKNSNSVLSWVPLFPTNPITLLLLQNKRIDIQLNNADYPSRCYKYGRSVADIMKLKFQTDIQTIDVIAYSAKSGNVCMYPRTFIDYIRLFSCIPKIIGQHSVGGSHTRSYNDGPKLNQFSELFPLIFFAFLTALGCIFYLISEKRKSITLLFVSALILFFSGVWLVVGILEPVWH